MPGRRGKELRKLPLGGRGVDLIQLVGTEFRAVFGRRFLVGGLIGRGWRWRRRLRIDRRGLSARSDDSDQHDNDRARTAPLCRISRIQRCRSVRRMIFPHEAAAPQKRCAQGRHNRYSPYNGNNRQSLPQAPLFPPNGWRENEIADGN